jgi:serine protease inhibitor
MELQNCAFPDFSGLFDDDGKKTEFELNSTDITEGTPLVNFNHNASFSTGRHFRDPITYESIYSAYLAYRISRLRSYVHSEKSKLKTLAEIYEVVIPFDHPFLFFVIDDPTGAILIMGRSSGHNQEGK